MTNQEMFTEAHKMARADRAFEATAYTMGARSHAYYFRLALLTLQDERRTAVTGMARAFQVIEPKRVWA